MIEEDLSRAERLLLQRERARENPRDAAARWGVSAWEYAAWEAGDDGDAPEVSLGGLEVWEHYRILRERSGLTREQVGAMMGWTASAVREAERGLKPIGRLADFWGL